MVALVVQTYNASPAFNRLRQVLQFESFSLTEPEIVTRLREQRKLRVPVADPNDNTAYVAALYKFCALANATPGRNGDELVLDE